MTNNKSMNDHNKGLEKKLYEMYKDRIDNYSIQQLEILLDTIGLLNASIEELKAFEHIFATRIGELQQLEICKEYEFNLNNSDTRIIKVMAGYKYLLDKDVCVQITDKDDLLNICGSIWSKSQWIINNKTKRWKYMEWEEND